MITGQPPSVLMFNRRLRSKIDLLKPDLRREVENKQYQQVYQKPGRATTQFQVGQPVLSRNYRSAEKWLPATICHREGPLTYQVKVGESINRHHANQLVNKPSTNSGPQRTEAYVQTEEQSSEPEDSTEAMDTAGFPPDKVQSPANNTDSIESYPGSGLRLTERRYPTQVRRPPERLNLKYIDIG